MTRSAYLAAEGYEQPLAEELTRRQVAISGWHGRLALSPDPAAPASWAQDIWLGCEEAPVASIREAVDTLRAVQRNWSLYAVGQHRRAALIAARLPPVRAAPLRFPDPAPTSHLGGWTLLGADRLLLSAAKGSAFPNGEARFVEDRAGPPSRAYLKLWEALTLLGQYPAPGERCLDLGASPGGWSWVLASLGADVTAVDKAPLDAGVAAMPGVSFRRESAFGLAAEPVDWLVCDVIAYPARIRGLIERWVGSARRIVCTVKFQGATDHDTAAALEAIPGARLVHLFHNKHELTFLWSGP